VTRAVTKESGFAVDLGPQAVRVRAWGFWDEQAATAFTTAVLDALRVPPRRGQLVIDATNLPQRDDGQRAFRDVIAETAQLGPVRVELVVTNAITKMQLARLIRELGASHWTLTSSLPVASGGE
jgi:hypothetical protein